MKKILLFTCLFLALFVSCEPENTTYEVTYNYHSNQLSTTKTVLANTKLEEPEQPTNSHYTFGGWYTDETYSTKWNFENNMVQENLTLHAKWIPDIYTVTFKNSDNQTIGTKNVEYNKTLNDGQKIKISIYGYKIKNLYTDQNCTTPFETTSKISSDLTLYSVLEEETFTLPVIHINSESPISDRTNWIEANMTITGAAKDSYNLSNQGITIKGRGNSTWGMPKKCYSIKLDDKANLFGIANGKHKQYALIANYSDKTLIRNQLAYYLGNNVFTNMAWAPHTKQVILFLNGEYLGIYLLVERIKINDKLVNITDISEVGSSGGWIVEVNARLDETYNWTTTHGIPISLKDPDDYAGYQSIETKINEIEDVLYSTGTDWIDPTNGWRKYLDEDSFIDWYLVNEIAKNCDSGWFSSVYMYYSESDSKIHMGPLWDFDIGFGNINYNGCNTYSGFHVKYYGWDARLFKDPTFVANVKARWNTIKNTLDIENTIDNLSTALISDSTLNFEKWNILGQYVWPNADGYETRITYSSEVDYLTDWLEERIEWLDTNINAL